MLLGGTVVHLIKYREETPKPHTYTQQDQKNTNKKRREDIQIQAGDAVYCSCVFSADSFRGHTKAHKRESRTDGAVDENGG